MSSSDPTKRIYEFISEGVMTLSNYQRRLERFITALINMKSCIDEMIYNIPHCTKADLAPCIAFMIEEFPKCTDPYLDELYNIYESYSSAQSTSVAYFMEPESKQKSFISADTARVVSLVIGLINGLNAATRLEALTYPGYKEVVASAMISTEADKVLAEQALGIINEYLKNTGQTIKSVGDLFLTSNLRNALSALSSLINEAIFLAQEDYNVVVHSLTKYLESLRWKP